MSPNKCILSRVWSRWSYQASSLPSADSGCNSRLSSIASNATSRSCTERPAGATTFCGRPSKCRSARGPMAGRSAPDAASAGQATTDSHPAASSSCRCGRSQWCSSTRSGASIAHAAGSSSSSVPWADGKSRLTISYQWFSGRLGSAAVLEGSGHRLSHHLGARPRLGPTCRRVGSGEPRFGGRRKPSASTRSSGSAAIII